MGVVRLVAPTTPVEVAPGDRTVWPLGVANEGAACRLRLSATGSAAPWLGLPLEVALGPGETRELSLRLAPAIDAAPVGAVVPFVVHASGDGQQTTSVAAVVVLTARERAAVVLEARSATFVRHTTVAVVVRSHGSSRVSVALAVTPAEVCTLSDDVVSVDPAGNAATQVQVRPTLRWWGTPRAIVVNLAWGGASTGEASVTVTQRPVLAGRVMLGATLALALGLLAGLLALRVLG